MVYDKIIVGKFVDLRSITPDDAEFSYNIRADKKNNPREPFLHYQPTLHINNQLKYIKINIIHYSSLILIIAQLNYIFNQNTTFFNCIRGLFYSALILPDLTKKSTVFLSSDIYILSL